MQTVAHHLQIQAIAISGSTDADLFARSAFNRYYYGLYLYARRRLFEINSDWDIKAHASLPDFLRGRILKEISGTAKKARKLNDHQLSGDCARAKNSALDLASILERANAARKTADYEPDILVQFSANRFALSDVSINEAHLWLERAETHLNSIYPVLKSRV